MSTKKTYHIDNNDPFHVPSEELTSVLLEDVDFPVLFGLELRSQNAWDVPTFMDEWFSYADEPQLNRVKVLLEQLQRPDFLEEYNYIKASGRPTSPFEGFAFVARTVSFEMGAALLFAAERASVAELTGPHLLSALQVAEMRKTAQQHAAKLSGRLANGMHMLAREIEQWTFNRKQLLPNIGYALNWVEKRLASTPHTSSSQKTAGSIEQLPVGSRDLWSGLLLKGFTVEELDDLLFQLGMLTSPSPDAVASDARGSVWVGLAEGLRLRQRLKLSNRAAVYRAFTSRYGSAICSASTFGRPHEESNTKAAEICASILARLPMP